MNVSRTMVAISIDHDRLVALAAAVGDSVKVESWHTAPFPADLNLKDAAAVGRWLGTELERAKIPRSKVVFSVPRGEVVLKRLRLPTAVEAELAGMVQLQMAKQMTMASEGTAVDFVPLSSREPGAEASMSVLAAALPGDQMAWYRTVAKAAGCKIERLALRASGLAALLTDASQRHTGSILGVSAGWGSVEFVVVDQGELVFVRAADFGLASVAGDEHAFAQRVAVEVKRTWMSHRVTENTAEVDAVMVAGEGKLASELAERCGEALEMAWKVAPLPGKLDVSNLITEADKLAAAPLMGLLLECGSDRPAIDFAHPRKAPDLGAMRRQRVLAAALGLIVVGGASYVFASGELATLKKQVKVEKEQATRLRTQYSEMLKEDARLQHLEKWTAAEFDWLAHTRWISETMPDTKQAQLQELTGGLAAEVEFVPKDGGYTPTGWQLRQVAKINLEGRTQQRQTANDLREKLLGSAVYQVETKGADVQDQFRLELVTTRPRPEDQPPGKPVATKPAAPKTKPASEGNKEEGQ
jgi:Tfp pilus assembly PilM family ATPase